MEAAAAKILLVVNDPARKAHCLEFLTDYIASIHIVDSLREAVVLASEEAHCGILVDVVLMVRAPTVIKAHLEDMLCGLPSAILNIDLKKGVIQLLPRSSYVLGCRSIGRFMAVCAGFRPQIIFPRTRKAVHFNVLLDFCPEMNNPDRTVCINISTGGCFLFNTRDDIGVESTIWIRLFGLDHDLPIEGVVVWKREWGTATAIPGIGVKFKDVPVELKTKLSRLILPDLF